LTPPLLREAPTAETPEKLLDALLSSVSHDLRSPLLTLSLSAELIRESVREAAGEAESDGSTEVALDAMKIGTEDLERMLKALATIARARRRDHETRPVPLRMLLGGHIVISDFADLERLIVAVDATPIRELLDLLCGEDPSEIELTRTDSHVVLSIPSRVALPELDASPLLALASALPLHAGTVIEDLASLQLQLARQSCVIELEGGVVRLWLPVRPDAA